MVRWLSRQSVVLVTLRSYVRDSCGPDFTFGVDHFLSLISLRTLLKNVNLKCVYINGPLAKSAERGASNA